MEAKKSLQSIDLWLDLELSLEFITWAALPSIQMHNGARRCFKSCLIVYLALGLIQPGCNWNSAYSTHFLHKFSHRVEAKLTQQMTSIIEIALGRDRMVQEGSKATSGMWRSRTDSPCTQAYSVQVVSAYQWPFYQGIEACQDQECQGTEGSVGPQKWEWNWTNYTKAT